MGGFTAKGSEEMMGEMTRISGCTGGARCGLSKAALALAFLGAIASPLLSRSTAVPTPATKTTMEIFFVDVEGGQATLFVAPGGQSLLIDTGFADHADRDANRIVAAAKLAGIKKIDYVLITHYHGDHVGGVAQLAAKMPIGAFVDHGPNRETTSAETEKAYQDYLAVIAARKIKRLTATPGGELTIGAMHVTIVSADGMVIPQPLEGAGKPNPACNATEARAADQTENARSVGVVVTFGAMRILDLGDLTWDRERDLMCPVNKLGKIGLFVVSHHGNSDSNSPALVRGITPRVAIMNNGETKGGAPDAWERVKDTPSLEDLWQLHFATANGDSHNSPDPFIANAPGPDAGYYLKVTAWPDSTFEVFNSRTQIAKHYVPPRED
jgi:competence protein ComEC